LTSGVLVVIIEEHKVTYQGMWKMERVERGYGFETRMRMQESR